jgi:hypothetical protein
MPLDDLKWGRPDADTDIPLARRRRLIEALRDNSQPWDFRNHRTCALGLAVRLGIASDHGFNSVGAAIGISDAQAWRLFLTTQPYRVRVLRFFTRQAFHTEVTASMVADALEQIDG